MEFETKCVEALDKITNTRKKKIDAVCKAYIAHKVSDLAKEVLRTYTVYEQENREMKHIVINKDVFENTCDYALERICKDVKDAGESYVLFKNVTDALQKYKRHRAPIDGHIVDLIKKYSTNTWVGTVLVDINLIEDSINHIEEQQDKLYDILRKYEQGKELKTSEYVTLQECQPFCGCAT